MEKEFEGLSPKIAAKFFEIRMGDKKINDEEIFAANKAALGEFMRQHGLDRVVVTYSGSGDNGGIDEVTFFEGTEVVVEQVPIALLEVDWNYKKQKKEVKVIKLKPDDAFGHMAEEALCLSEHEGWELDEGGDGEVTFTLSGDDVVVHIVHNQYYRGANTHEHTL
jgi:hypothetical protein